MDLDHHRGGSGEALVLVHGIGLSWRGWRPILPLLERSFDVLLLPRQGRRFERLIPDCELRYLKGLGHMPMSDDPDLLAGEIRRWCVPPAAAPA